MNNCAQKLEYGFGLFFRIFYLGCEESLMRVKLQVSITLMIIDCTQFNHGWQTKLYRPDIVGTKIIQVLDMSL